jgi:hypothetical protein
MSKSIKRQVVSIKTESTYNTDSSPVGSDSILVEDLTSYASEGLRMIERPAIRANISPLQQIYAGRLATVSFSCEVKGSGVAGTPPELDAAYGACGKEATIVASTSVTYNPVSTGHESVTIHAELDGLLTKLTGCRGLVTHQLETGNKIMASFTFTGHVTNPTDAVISSPVYDSTVPSPLIGVPFSVGGFSAVINSLSLDMGATLSTPPSIASLDGYGEIFITAYAPTGSFDPEIETVTTHNFFADFTAGNTKAITTGVIGSTAGNRVKFDIPKAAYTDISLGDRDGVAVYEIPFGMIDNAGDDFYSIEFT